MCRLLILVCFPLSFSEDKQALARRNATFSILQYNAAQGHFSGFVLDLFLRCFSAVFLGIISSCCKTSVIIYHNGISNHCKVILHGNIMFKVCNKYKIKMVLGDAFSLLKSCMVLLLLTSAIWSRESRKKDLA